jgi:enoyl-CoA hydratase/carnithine racemase
MEIRACAPPCSPAPAAGSPLDRRAPNDPGEPAVGRAGQLATKQVLERARDWPLAEFFERQEEYVAPVRASADAGEGAAAFVEKREPVWSGR